MQIKQLTQFHENPAIIAWWCASLGWALRRFTPFRRRAILAAAAVWTCVKSTLRIVKSGDLPGPADGVVAGLLVALALVAIAWLLYRAAAGFASLPSWVRKHPQLTLHSIYWGFLLVLWTTAPGSGLWRQVLAGVALIFPLLVWRFAYILLSGQYGRMTGTRFSDHFLALWPIYGGSNTPCGSGFGKRAAAIQTALDAAKLDEPDPAAWLRDTLGRLPTCLNSQIDSLSPLRPERQLQATS